VIEMAKHGDDFDDLSWLYNEENGGKKKPGHKRPSLDDLYADEDMVELLPPLEGDEESQSSSKKTGLLSRFSREKDEPEFAGVDTSEPSREERKKARRREGAMIADQDDPFAKLVTPLSDAEVSVLRAELSKEEILLVKWERKHRLSARWRTLGLILSFAVLALLSIRFGHSYVDQNLKNPSSPAKLVEKIGKDKADALMFALAIMLPFLSIGLLTDFFEQTLKTFASRSLRALALAMLSAFTLVTVGTLIVGKQTIAAAATLAVWMAIRAIIRAVLGRGEDL
jgi:hypothetical protein